jgi:hypothetical protein
MITLIFSQGDFCATACSQWIYEGTGWLCHACAPEHEGGEEMLLPVVNSPRVIRLANAKIHNEPVKG